VSTGLEEVSEVLGIEDEVPEEFEPELVEMLPKGYLSPSQVSTFLQCPRKWQLLYVDGKPRRTSARMFQGVFVHGAVEEVLKGRLATGKLPPLEAATDAFSDAFNASKELIDDWEDENEGTVKDVGIKCTKAFYNAAAPKATPVAIEKTFTAVIKDPEGRIKLPILGRIDSIQVQTNTEDEYQAVREKVSRDASTTIIQPRRVHDLKVVTSKWSQNDLDNDLQFALYAGVEHVPDVQVDQIVKGKAASPNPRYEKLTSVFSNEQVKWAERVVLDVGKSIALGHFPVTSPDNWSCSERWCSMWFSCRGRNQRKK
jgi:hypothetical protein